MTFNIPRKFTYTIYASLAANSSDKGRCLKELNEGKKYLDIAMLYKGLLQSSYLRAHCSSN